VRFPIVFALAALGWSSLAGAQGTSARLESHPNVSGGTIDSVELVAPTGTRIIDWKSLAGLSLTPGDYVLRTTIAGGDGLYIEFPPCAGRTAVRVDGKNVGQGNGPVVAPLPARPAQAHGVEIAVHVSSYERRIACGYAPLFGARSESSDRLTTLSFPSAASARGGGQAVVFVPPKHDATKPAALLVGAHPWNGSVWTYAAYAELLDAAAKRDVVLLFPNGLGNSLYTADAEDEIVRAIDAVAQTMSIDPRRISIWGASMGGAGATTIAFHRPDRFAAAISLFGDSKYDLSTYVKSILPDEAAARRVNALDVVDNARHLEVWLIHGESDRISPIAQSIMLDVALHERGFTVHFDRIPKAGHDGALVARFASAIVDKAATVRRIEAPTRVTYRSVRSSDGGAYGVRINRSGREDAFVDIEREGDHVVVRKAVGVRAIELARGALGLRKGARIERAEGVPSSLEIRLDDDVASP
jgi:pimeloyl-ACP methyl ester carboxylesterase